MKIGDRFDKRCCQQRNGSLTDMSIKQRAMKPNRCRGILSGWKCGKAFTAAALFAATTPVVFAHGVATGAQGQAAMSPWSLGEAFTFLFLTLGPLNVIGPFVAMTQGRDTAFKRRLAFRAFIIATIALLVAARLAGSAPPAPPEPFVPSKLATITRHVGIAEYGGRSITGFPAWLMWGLLHLRTLGRGHSKLSILANWLRLLITYRRSARLVVETSSTAEQ